MAAGQWADEAGPGPLLRTTLHGPRAPQGRGQAVGDAEALPEGGGRSACARWVPPSAAGFRTGLSTGCRARPGGWSGAVAIGLAPTPEMGYLTGPRGETSCLATLAKAPRLQPLRIPGAAKPRDRRR